MIVFFAYQRKKIKSERQKKSYKLNSVQNSKLKKKQNKIKKTKKNTNKIILRSFLRKKKVEIKKLKSGR